MQHLGVRLGLVEKGSFARAVDTVGVVAVDEHRIEAIQVRQDLLGTDTVYLVVSVEINLSDLTRPLYKLELGARKLRLESIGIGRGDSVEEPIRAARAFDRLGKTRSREWLVIASHSAVTSEARVIPAAEPEAVPRLIAARRVRLISRCSAVFILIQFSSPSRDLRRLLAFFSDWASICSFCPIHDE